MPAGQVLADRIPLVSVNAAFALLKVHRIAGQVPVDHRVAVSEDLTSAIQPPSEVLERVSQRINCPNIPDLPAPSKWT